MKIRYEDVWEDKKLQMLHRLIKSISRIKIDRILYSDFAKSV